MSNFNEGQKVAMMFNHWGRRIERIANIDRVTATLAIIDGMKYNRETGREHGRQYGANCIIAATPEILAEFAEQRWREDRRRFLCKFLDGNWQSMGEDNLDKVAAALGFTKASGTHAAAEKEKQT